MSFDGSGTFHRDHTWASDAQSGIKIRADIHDTHDQDIANGISQCITKTGETTITTDIPWSNHKITGLAPGIAPTDAVNYGQLSTANTALDANSGGIVISGSSPNATLKFTGSSGPWGLSWTVPGPINGSGMFFGVNADNWVWNDKPDGTGTDVLKLSEAAMLTLTRKTDDATGATLLFDINSASPAANDVLSVITTNGRNSAAAVKPYAQTYTHITDANSGSEDATTVHSVMVSGTLQPRLTLNAIGLHSYGTVIAGNTLFMGSGAGAILGTETAGTVLLRPNGVGSGVGQAYVGSDGTFIASAVTASGAVQSNSGNLITLAGVGANCHVVYKDENGNTRGYTYWNRAIADMVMMNSAGASLSASATSLKSNVSFTYKPGGGAWQDSSDSRIKNVLGDYESGLDAIRGLHPVRYTFKGNDTPSAPSHMEMPGEPLSKDEVSVPYPNSPHYIDASSGREFVGLIAQEVEAVMPGMVSQRSAFIDGVEVTDLRDLDTTNLIFTLINAVKQLSARIEALEAQP